MISTFICTRGKLVSPTKPIPSTQGSSYLSISRWHRELTCHIKSLPDRAAGVCTVPFSTRGPGSYSIDGCQILAESLPGGGTLSELYGGKVAVHETGHWFGLAHTFENGCNEPGDYVNDTPFEASPPKGRDCPTGRNSVRYPFFTYLHNDYGAYSRLLWCQACLGSTQNSIDLLPV